MNERMGGMRGSGQYAMMSIAVAGGLIGFLWLLGLLFRGRVI